MRRTQEDVDRDVRASELGLVVLRAWEAGVPIPTYAEEDARLVLEKTATSQTVPIAVALVDLALATSGELTRDAVIAAAMKVDLAAWHRRKYRQQGVLLAVFRAAPDLPPDYLPEHLDGQWTVLPGGPYAPEFAHREGNATAHATGRYEQREDGALAEVYEVRRS